LQQQGLSTLLLRLQQFIDVTQITYSLQQASGQMLHSGETIHLQGIELFALTIQTSLFFVPLIAEQDLGLGLHVQFAQLLSQTLHSVPQLIYVVAKGTILLLQARTEDTHLTGIIHQLIHEIRVYP